MTTSTNILSQQIVGILQKKEIKDIVISPGSRNAPLKIGFNRNDYFKKYLIVDERCAAFFGLGLSKSSKTPTALVCTSGSALLNYYPAISEAFYSNIPLIIISADRPQEWIDQGDGQTIRQQNIFSHHTIKSYQLKEGNSKDILWFNERILNEAINFAKKYNKPIHINVPFSEPLYNVEESHYSPKNIDFIKKYCAIDDFSAKKYSDIWNNSDKKLLLIGEGYLNEKLEKILNTITDIDDSTLVLKEVTSNINGHKFINCIDKLILGFSDKEKDIFKPNLLVVIGGAIVSKKIKELLRNYNIDKCWRINSTEEIEDCYQNISDNINIDTTFFFENVIYPNAKPISSKYLSHYLNFKNIQEQKHDSFSKKIKNFVDFKIHEKIINYLPSEEIVHLSNSSVVRYWQLFDIKNNNLAFCNRGTSGIDGSTSTAVGFSVNSHKNNTLITGDISFFYDSNALWNNYIKKNFKIIIINNGGGNIFRIINGPDTTKELETFFEAKHNLTAEHISKMYSFEYLTADNFTTLNNRLNYFFNSNENIILEIFTDGEKSASTLRDYFEYLS